MDVKQSDLFLTGANWIFFRLKMSHCGLSFYAWTEIVLAVIIAAVFDYTNEEHSRTEEANYIKLL